MKQIQKLEDIGLHQWLELMDFIDTNPSTEALAIQTISIMCEISTEKARRLTLEQMEDITSKINEILSQKPKYEPRFTYLGVKYGFIPNLDKITAGEFVDLETYQSSRKNLWKVMSVLYRPITEEHPYDHYLIEPYKGIVNEAFKEMPVTIALGAHLFFCDIGTELLSYIQKYLEPKTSEKAPRKLRDGGLKQAFSHLITSGAGLDGLSVYVMETLSNLNLYRNLLYIKPLYLQVIKSTGRKSKRKQSNENEHN